MVRTQARLGAAALAAVLFLTGKVSQAGDTTSLDLAGMDRSVAAGDDFWRFANGRHLGALRIPADREEYGVGAQVTETTHNRLLSLVAAPSVAGEQASGAAQVRWLYRTLLEPQARGEDALRQVRDALQKIQSASDHRSLMATLAQQDGISPLPFALAIGMNYRAPKENILSLSQAGLGLRLHQYEGKDAALLTDYADYLGSLLLLSGMPPQQARTVAGAAVRLEARLARQWLSPLQARSLRGSYRLVTVDTLAQASPTFPWDALLATTGVELRGKPVAVYGFDAIAGLANAWASAPLSDAKAWAMARWLDRAAPFLPEMFVSAHHQFHGSRVRGVAKPTPAAQAALKTVGDVLPFALGRMYADAHFDAASKRQVEAMVARIRAVMARRLQAAEWLGETTRSRALLKLANLHVEVGYPETWPDFSALELEGQSLLGGLRHIHQYNWRASAGKLHQPVDPAQGSMPPHWVGAGFTGTGVVFAAGILQAPYFDPTASLAEQYGAIGATIGHEITHAFDDTGLEFDEFGAVADQPWWTPDELDAFDTRASRLTAQFGRYRPLPDMAINGALTLGENLADLGGLSIAYEAYRDALEGRAAPVINGLTGDQRFFIAYAQQWRSKPTDGYLRTRLQSDVHSPAQWRVNGIVRNLPEWRIAFEVKPGHAMYQSATEDARLW